MDITADYSNQRLAATDEFLLYQHSGNPDDLPDEMKAAMTVAEAETLKQGDSIVLADGDVSILGEHHPFYIHATADEDEEGEEAEADGDDEDDDALDDLLDYLEYERGEVIGELARYFGMDTLETAILQRRVTLEEHELESGYRLQIGVYQSEEEAEALRQAGR